MCIVTNCAQFVSWSIRVLLPSDTFIILLDMGIHNFYCYSPSHTATDLLQLEGNSIYRNPQCGERPMDIGQNCTGCPTKILPLNLVGNVSSAFSEVFKNCKRDFKDQHWHQTPLSLHSLKKMKTKHFYVIIVLTWTWTWIYNLLTEILMDHQSHLLFCLMFVFLLGFGVSLSVVRQSMLFAMFYILPPTTLM